MEFIKDIVITKKVFDNDKIKIGDKILAKRILQCEIQKDGTRVNKVYDINEIAIILDLFNDEFYCEKTEPVIVELEFSFGSMEIHIEDVINGEWEFETIEEEKIKNEKFKL